MSKTPPCRLLLSSVPVSPATQSWESIVANMATFSISCCSIALTIAQVAGQNLFRLQLYLAYWVIHTIRKGSGSLLISHVCAVKPTLSKLTLIKWKDDKGKIQRFKLIKQISDKWDEMGTLVGLETAQLNGIKQSCLNEANKCCKEVFSHWLEEEDTSEYPKTWDGVCIYSSGRC